MSRINIVPTLLADSSIFFTSVEDVVVIGAGICRAAED
jgi:hypothetical protein